MQTRLHKGSGSSMHWLLHDEIGIIKIKCVCSYTINVLNFLNTFLFLFLNKMLDIVAEIHKMLVRIANREDPDQTASEEAV